jgi:hypothetical protein
MSKILCFLKIIGFLLSVAVCFEARQAAAATVIEYGGSTDFYYGLVLNGVPFGNSSPGQLLRPVSSLTYQFPFPGNGLDSGYLSVSNDYSVPVLATAGYSFGPTDTFSTAWVETRLQYYMEVSGPNQGQSVLVGVVATGSANAVAFSPGLAFSPGAYPTSALADAVLSISDPNGSVLLNAEACVYGPKCPPVGRESTPGYFKLIRFLHLNVGELYTITMYSEIIVLNTFGMHAYSSVDPYFIPPPGYTLDISPGIGNSPLPQTPLPAALPLFATGLGALGLLGWRRKRKNAAAIAAA